MESPSSHLNAQQDHKHMFGLLFSLKSLTAKMDPTSAKKKTLGCPNYLAKIFLVTHPRTGDLRQFLKYIYNLYVEYFVNNPLYNPGTPIRCELFNTTLYQYGRSIA